MNLCCRCGLDFSTVPAFDEHRVGVHAYTYAEGLARTPSRTNGRRCLDEDELKEAGWSRDRWGRWKLPAALEPHVLERVVL